jgi:pimeloyl-ACP methyl ester carboxylesterase
LEEGWCLAISIFVLVDWVRKVKKSKAIVGYFHNGLPYNQVGYGPRKLVIFQGLVFENKPLPARMAWLYSMYYQYLEEDFTTYIVLRKPGLPDGYSLQNMAEDYATMIKDEFGEPVDVIGVSTGGSIAQHFAADHPELVRKLIIHSSAYTLSDSTKRIQMRVGHLARQRQWREAYATMVSPTRYPKPVIWIGSLLAGMFGAPEDPSDLVVTIEAEDKFNFKERLGQITAPTLVVAGDQDPFYPEALFRETAEGIPNARLILYKGMGHPASGKQFRRDVLMFLKNPSTPGD